MILSEHLVAAAKMELTVPLSEMLVNNVLQVYTTCWQIYNTSFQIYRTRSLPNIKLVRKYIKLIV